VSIRTSSPVVEELAAGRLPPIRSRRFDAVMTRVAVPGLTLFPDDSLHAQDVATMKVR